MTAKSAESVVSLIAKTKLLPLVELKAAFGTWRQDAGNAGEAAGGDHLLRWLVKRGTLSNYQAARLARGQTDRYFLDQYKLLDKIGAGRMAGVYKAEHGLGQIVAVKVLPPTSVADPKIFGRFQREARLAIKLKHPHVVRTFHLGQDTGVYYLVMEYLEGETLEELLKRQGKMKPEDAVPILHQTLLGMQHLHEQGMIHRDINPSNLMLVPQPGAPANQPRVKLLDVGLGKKVRDDGIDDEEEDGALTMAGDLVGTPDYMAPEQAACAALADIRADVYSAGCVLFHALTGQPPFHETSQAKTLKRHATETPARVKTFNPAIPDGLQNILDVMLAKDLNKRYATPAHAAEALAAHHHAAAAPPEPVEAQHKLQKYENWLEQENLEDAQLLPLDPDKPPASIDDDVPFMEVEMAEE